MDPLESSLPRFRDQPYTPDPVRRASAADLLLMQRIATMVRGLIGVGLLLCLAGCQNRRLAVAEDAVIGPPPLRTTLDNNAATPLVDKDKGIVQASNETAGEQLLIHQLDEKIVARVGGQPVFAADVLRPYRPFIETQKQLVLTRVPASQRDMAFEQINGETSQLLHRAMDDYLDREIVLQAMKKKLKKEQIDGIEEQIDVEFDKRVEAVVAETGLRSRAELESLMTTPNEPAFEKLIQAWRGQMQMNPSTSLVESRQTFGKMVMASEFLNAKSEQKTDIDRASLLEYYRTHAEDYDQPLELRWDQIVVSHAANGGREKAKQLADMALAKLKKGVKFADVAKEHSDGPSAATGGNREWIQPGTLVDSNIEKRLFAMSEGEFSEVFDRGDRFEIVRASKRRGGYRTPFEKVQDTIRKRLESTSGSDARRDALEKLRAETEVVVLFEKPVERLSEDVFAPLTGR